MPALPQSLKDRLDARALAVFTTLTADGSPHSAPVWATYDGDDILISTLQGRQKEKNLRGDPRVSVVVVDPGNPYIWNGILGRATVSVDPDDLIGHLSQIYTGEPYPQEHGVTRVIVRVQAERVIGQ